MKSLFLCTTGLQALSVLSIVNKLRGGGVKIFL